MSVVRIPLVGSADQRRIAQDVLFDQVYQDCMFDVLNDEATGTKRILVSSRHAYAANANSYPSGASGAGTAILCWLGTGATDILTAYGNTNSTIYLNNTSLGAITGQVIHMSETDISGTPNAVFVSNASSGRTWFYPNGGSLTEITNANFPPKQTPALTIAGNIVHKDGWAFVMCTNGQIANSDLNSLANWTAGNFISNSDSPDPGLGLARLGEFILGFGKVSIEFFRNVGNASGSPLSRIGKTVYSAAVNQHCILEALDTVFWAASSGPAGPGVYKFSGGEPVKISNQTIDDDVASQAVFGAELRLHLWADYGHVFVIYASEARAWAYDQKSNQWTYWTNFTTTGSGGVKKTTTGFVSGSNAITSFAVTSQATIYQILDPLTYKSPTIITTRNNFGTLTKKHCKSLRLVGDFASSITYSISWTDDDYATYSAVRTVTRSDAGKGLQRCGQFRDRAFKISWSNGNTTNSRLSALELDLEPLVT